MPRPRDPFRPVSTSVLTRGAGNERLQKARRELLAVVEDALAARTNGDPIVMGWTRNTYAKMVRCGQKVVGFPKTVVFAHPGDVGSIKKLKKLTKLWEAGVISFADATADDRHTAELDPHGVFPGKQEETTRAEAADCALSVPPNLPGLPSPSLPSPPRPTELVLRPDNLMPCFELPVKGSANPEAIARMQRQDTKKSRTRRLRGSKAGLKTPPLIVASPTKNGEWGAKRFRAMPTCDRIDKFYSVPEGGVDSEEGREDGADRVDECEVSKSGGKRKSRV